MSGTNIRPGSADRDEDVDAYPLAVRVGHVMEWLDEHLPHRAMWLPGRRLICSAADTSYGWGPDATDWQAKATWLDRWIVRNLG